MKLYIGGGVGEHGRNSFLLETSSFNIMVDCGLLGDMTPIYSKGQIKKTSFLFLTHSHRDHSGGLSRLVKNGFEGLVLSSRETHKQLDFSYDNWQDLRRDKDKYPKRIEKESFSYSFGQSGHCPGSLWFLLEVEGKKILFSGDYSEESRVYGLDPLRNIRADLAILDCGQGNEEISLEDFNDGLVEYLDLSERIPILLPLPKYGRGADIYKILDGEYRGRVFLDKNFKNLFEKGKDPSLESLDLEGRKDESGLLFLADPPLKKEKSRDLAKKVLEKSGIILSTGYTYPETFMKGLLKEGKARKLSFPTHPGYGNILDLCRENDFKRIILNHYPGPIDDYQGISIEINPGEGLEI